MPTAPFLVSYELTQPTASVPTGKLRLVANEGDSFGPLTLELVGLGYGIETMDAPATGPGNYAYERAGLAPNAAYSVRIYDASPAHLPGFTQEFTIDSAPNPVLGCMDPAADNYDPTATQDSGACAYSPKLTLTPLPELAPLGVPLLATLASNVVLGAGPAPAALLLDLAGLVSTAQAVPGLAAWLRVDGYLFTFGALTVPGRFLDAPSLLDALSAQPALAAAYTFSQPSAQTVRLLATTPGLPGTPTVSVSNPALIGSVLTPGVAGLWSQRRYRWGCYLEVWAGCGTFFGGTVDKSTAQLADRFELPYRAGNAYEFDVATALRKFTGHAYPLGGGTCPDRLISYFVRFGELYADTPTGLRRRRTTYESGIAWGLEAVELGPLVADGLRLLSARPTPWVVGVGDRLPAAWLGAPNAGRKLVLRTRLATSRATTDVALPGAVSAGQVTHGANVLAAPGALAGQLIDSVSGAVVASLDFSGKGQKLTFVNRQGYCDTVYFAGNAEDATKRTAATFTNTAGPQNQSAELALPVKLYTGVLDYATWDWLRRELGTAPAAWLETAAGPVPVLVSDVVTESDRQKGEYSLSVEYQFVPVRGLSN